MLFVHLTVFFCIFTLSQTTSGPIIQTPLGKLLGWERRSRSGRIYQAWTSVPFARPPVGKLRFKAPLPPKKWKGVYNATDNMPFCMQIPLQSWTAVKFRAREDCLYLNVYKPKESANKSMPVIVYFYGGANLRGYVGRRWSADYLMDEDLVLVVPNFRTNGFGLLSLGDNVIPGNYMYKDNVQALRWIKQNIASFNGNPDRIILFAESSGGFATQALINSPMSRDLVAAGVSHSGTLNPWESFPQDGRIKQYSMKIIRRVGCERETSQEMLNCLQQLDAIKLVRSIFLEADSAIHLNLGPVVEPKDLKGAFITEDTTFNNSPIPWMNTITNGERSTFDITLRLDPSYAENAYLSLNEHLTEWLSRRFKDPQKVEQKLNKIMSRYYVAKLPISNFTETMATMYTDVNFVYSSIHSSRDHGGPVWMGYLEYKKDQSLLIPYPYNLAGHAMQMDFYFNRTGPYLWSERESTRDVMVSKRFIRYLVDFAYQLDPTPPGSPYSWPRYRTNEILRMNAPSDFMGDQSFVDKLMELYDFWDDIMEWPLASGFS